MFVKLPIDRGQVWDLLDRNAALLVTTKSENLGITYMQTLVVLLDVIETSLCILYQLQLSYVHALKVCTGHSCEAPADRLIPLCMEWNLCQK